MMIPRIVRGGPEKVFAIVRNSGATTLSDGHLAVFDVATTANWGSDVAISGTGGSQLIVAGIISGKDITTGEFGLCQIYGFHNNALTLTTAIAAGASAISTTTAGAIAAGAAGDDPSARVGVVLRLGASGAFRCGVMIKCM